MLEAYFDESGITGDAPVCVMMGFVGTSSKWSLFEQSWASVTAGVPFHAKRFFARNTKGDRLDLYRDWSNADASRYLNGMLDAITSRVVQKAITPIGAIVDIRAFNALSHAERQYVTGCFLDHRLRMIGTGAPSRPYFAALIQCVVQAAKCARGRASVDFVFDQNETFMPLVQKQYDVLTRLAEEDFCRRLGKLSFRSSESAGGLQAADLAAYCLYHQSVIRPQHKPDLAAAIVRLADVFHESKGRLSIYSERNLRRTLSLPKAIEALKRISAHTFDSRAYVELARRLRYHCCRLFIAAGAPAASRQRANARLPGGR